MNNAVHPIPYFMKFNQVRALGRGLDLKLGKFNTVLNMLKYHHDNILYFFDKSNIYANAETLTFKYRAIELIYEM